MEDQKAVELYIFENIQNGLEPAYIADELLKLWSKNKLSIKAKCAVGHFCISNGYVQSLIAMLRHDLIEHQNTYWPLFYYFYDKDLKDVNDAFLTAASKADQLLELAHYAQTKSKDPRWQKIINAKIEVKGTKTVVWPELKNKIENERQSLNLTDCYEFSVALSEMGLHDLAIEVLNYQKKNWTTKELLLETDFLLKSHNYVSALENAQKVKKENTENKDELKAALYFSAIAYHGLNDKEQGIAILKGIQAHDPDYKDINELIRVWEKGK